MGKSRKRKKRKSIRSRSRVVADLRGGSSISRIAERLGVSRKTLLKSLPKRRNPERNSPCPCGSKKKYKNCCFKTLGGHARQRSLRPQVAREKHPTSPVGGEVVLFCIHSGKAFQGHHDPENNIFIQSKDITPELHWFYIVDGMEFSRPGKPQQKLIADWMAICNRCFLEGRGTADAAQIGGDYVWPEEPSDLPPLIKPSDPTSNRKRKNPFDEASSQTGIFSVEDIGVDSDAVKEVFATSADFDRVAKELTRDYPGMGYMMSKGLRRAFRNDRMVDLKFRELVRALVDAAEDSMLG